MCSRSLVILQQLMKLFQQQHFDLTSGKIVNAFTKLYPRNAYPQLVTKYQNINSQSGINEKMQS